ncbi:MAG: hypothetical protein ACI3X4_07340, partial [Bacteroidaceae bacterium]
YGKYPTHPTYPTHSMAILSDFFHHPFSCRIPVICVRAHLHELKFNERPADVHHAEFGRETSLLLPENTSDKSLQEKKQGQ